MVGSLATKLGKAGVVAVVLAGAITAAVARMRPDLLNLSADPFVVHCAEDDEIPSRDRQDVDGAALGFVRRILDSDVGGAHAELSATAKAVTSLEQIADAVGTIRRDGPYGPARVTRSYLIDLSAGRGRGEVLTACQRKGDNGGGDPPRLASDRKQGHVVVVTSNSHGRQAFTVWMHPDRGRWRVDGFTFKPAT